MDHGDQNFKWIPKTNFPYRRDFHQKSFRNGSRNRGSSGKSIGFWDKRKTYQSTNKVDFDNCFDKVFTAGIVN